MEKPNKIKKNKFIQLWLIIGIIAGFALIVFYSITYLNNKVLCDLDCRIQNETSLIVVLLSLFGMFIGSLTYYFISEKYEKKIVKIHRDAGVILKFLDKEEKLIINSLLKHKGKTTQSDISKDTNLSRVKIFRSLRKLENRGIIIKMPYGMTNIIEIEKELKDLLIE